MACLQQHRCFSKEDCRLRSLHLLLIAVCVGKGLHDVPACLEASVSLWPRRAHYAATSQVVAEKEAWKIAEEHGLHLVTVHPVFVVGPVLSARTDATSVNMIKVGSGPHPAPSSCCAV